MEKKNLRFHQSQIDHNRHHDRNILRTKGCKCKTTKDVHRCHGYHETCWWNSEWCPCQGLCSLQKMDQRVIQQQTFLAPKRQRNYITPKNRRNFSLLFCWSLGPGQPRALYEADSALKIFQYVPSSIFQSLKYH